MAHKIFFYIGFSINRTENRTRDLKKNKEELNKVKPDHIQDYFELKIQEAGALLTHGDAIW